MTSTLRWFKSSYSSSTGGECLEVAYIWRKSSYSSDSGGECVEVAPCPHAIHIRDSKNKQGPSLAVSPRVWAGFLTHVTK
ncbi:DUF397 domain-containing protein [Streptomyces sp. TRM68367]|uniref:DUF397 domain-containing protein n=1 Tax=Streptomyces sp. TRM68367 TaxID=2758415 RepID=UPI00165B26CF|nr:DUF397 domain-containing protein [Streptomyces sp. TRM68367]MBC9729947.1 DUF397 domain-containing protein [Streptomyces sp. TRM68367]